jgi:alkanesulfonate monooxygenase SsuD/methylene tetrahydromethanopterin reductase-like flavin-dependent oxidoreductase (luciferase family)
MGGRSGEPGPTDAWTTLSALAVQTERIRLGTLVTSATFRLPGPLAIAVAQADQMSGGRIEFGLGASWFEAEHSSRSSPGCGGRRPARRTRSAASTTPSSTRPPSRSRPGPSR